MDQIFGMMNLVNKLALKTIWIIVGLFVLSFSLIAQLGDCPPTYDVQYFLHLAHTRTGANPLLDPEVELIDFSYFDMLWLGGDLALATSEDDSIMLHVDSVFHLGNETTLWSLGNHDYADLNRIQNFTHRNAFYASYQNNITFLVLDTQDSLSNITGDQLELFKSVTDTIQESTHLIILHHKLIWMYGNPDLEPIIGSVANGGLGPGACFSCIHPNNFYSHIYPELLEVEKRGIEVICVAGDIGFRRSEFQHTTEEGIQFLASGIEAGKTNNKALLFIHNSTLGTLDWEYVFLTQLLTPMDKDSPVLHSVSAVPDSVFPGDVIRIIVEAEDEKSGLAEIRLDIVSLNGEQTISFSSLFEDLTQMEDGKYAIDLVLPDTAVSGIWNISAISVMDFSENGFCQHYEDSVPASFFVQSTSVSVAVKAKKVLIYPNPGTGRFHYSGISGVEIIQAIDQTGRITNVSDGSGTNLIDLSAYPQGIYFIRMITSKGHVLLERIVIH